MSVWLRSNRGVSHVFHDRGSYMANEHGCVVVPPEAVQSLLSHGFTRVSDEEVAALTKPKEEPKEEVKEESKEEPKKEEPKGGFFKNKKR